MSSAIWSTVSSLLGLPILAVATIVEARLLGAEQFGKLAVYTLLYALVGGITDLGVGTAILRRGALAAGAGDLNQMSAEVRAGTTWSLLQVPWSVLVTLLILPSWHAQQVAVVGIMLSLCFLGPSHFLNMASRMRVPNIMKTCSALLSTIAGILAAYYSRRADDTFAYSLVGTTILTPFLCFAVPAESRWSTFIPSRVRVSKRDVAFGIGTLANSQLNTFVFSRSEVFFFLPRQAMARGRFAAAQTVAARATLPMDALTGALPIGLANAAGRGAELLWSTFKVSCDTVVFLTAATAPFVLVGTETLSEPVFGKSYGNVGVPALLLTVGSLMQSCLTPLLSLRFAERAVLPLLTAGFLSAVVDATLAYILVPTEGLYGAVIANLVSVFVYSLTTVVMMYRSHKRDRFATIYFVRVTFVILISALPGALLAVCTRPVAFALALPAGLVTFAITCRLPIVDATSVIRNHLEVLPSAVSRVLKLKLLRSLTATG